MRPSLRLPAEALTLLKKAAAADRQPVYLVGGTLRDALLGRPVHDLDLAAHGARALAQALARALKGHFVILDEKNQVFRVALDARFKLVRQIDVAKIQGKTILEDLKRRDFTINALALPLEALSKPLSARQLLDPRNGLADLAAKKLRAESASLFEDDPLRLLRALRIAAQLDFTIEPKTLAAMSKLRRLAQKPAGERIQAELLALCAAPDASRWLKIMDQSGILTTVFPELEPARLCAVAYYGEGGVMKHSLDTAARVDFMLERLPQVFGAKAKAVKAALPLRPLLILAALLHDISKAETARQADGRLRFFGHDLLGAKRVASLLERLKFSRHHTEIISSAVRHHLRPGHMAAGGAITDKAVYRFFRDVGDNALSLLLVCWADHASYLDEKRLAKFLKLSQRAPGFGLERLKVAEARKTIFHLQAVNFLLSRLLMAPDKPVPDPLLNGHDVMKALDIPAPKSASCLKKCARPRPREKSSRARTPWVISLK